MSGIDEDQLKTRCGFTLHVYVCACGTSAVDGGSGYDNRQGLVRSAGECRGYISHLACVVL